MWHLQCKQPPVNDGTSRPIPNIDFALLFLSKRIFFVFFSTLKGSSSSSSLPSLPFHGYSVPVRRLSFLTMAGDKVSNKSGSYDEQSNGEEKKQHAFYFVKQHPYVIESGLEQDHQNLILARSGVIEKLKAKRAEKSELFKLRDSLKSEHKRLSDVFNEMRVEMEPLKQALGRLRSNDNGLCSSQQELNDKIRSFNYRIQHESNTLNEEKQLIKEISRLERTRGDVIANEASRARIIESFGFKKDIQDQVKSMSCDLDGVIKERQAISERIDEMSEKINASKEEIRVLEDELKIVTEKRNKSYSNIHKTKKQLETKNANFNQSRAVLQKARDLAANKNVKELEALSLAEDEKFMSLWCSNKNFREDYEKRLLPSLDARELSRDGRMRNPEVVPEARTEQFKEDPVSGNKAKDNGKAKEAKPSSDDDEVYGLGKKPEKEELEVDEATLKEMRRQEEIAKAKQAMERKQKLADRSAEKAATRAQKEAEKKEKEREKKAKKKAVVPEEVPDKVEDQEVEEKVAKGKKQMRNRIQRKGIETPRPTLKLKRKKSSNYYKVWAILAALVLLVLGYYYAL
ncbi:unnamed protein product [Microthlaspi erraticum]|uniref:Proton pump-interactor 1 n=1 Tax=Microthlaspi erraticum TaxID=1685480 RepID=A0A6D2KBD2_9BRAS|nr:unnamed protein product [Microthlaspi erraticum]